MEVTTPGWQWLVRKTSVTYTQGDTHTLKTIPSELLTPHKRGNFTLWKQLSLLNTNQLWVFQTSPSSHDKTTTFWTCSHSGAAVSLLEPKWGQNLFVNLNLPSRLLLPDLGFPRAARSGQVLAEPGGIMPSAVSIPHPRPGAQGDEPRVRHV